jgi:hypothetical protein
VVGFEGKRAARWESKVMKLVAAQERWELVSPDAYASTARELDARKQSDVDIARVADALDAAAVISGRLVGRSRRGKLELTVRDGETGKVIDRLSLRVRRGKLGKKGDRRLERQLVAALDEVRASAPTRWRTASTAPPAVVPAKSRVKASSGTEIDHADGKAEGSPERRRGDVVDSARMPAKKTAEKSPERKTVEVKTVKPVAAKPVAARPVAARPVAARPVAKQTAPSKKPPVIEELDEDTEPVEVKTDQTGQVIDDEMPTILDAKKK